jgi:hypothetical protein
MSSVSLDRVKRGLALFVRATQPVDYLALYPAKVLKQNADGTLELVPDDARIPHTSNVPIRLGIPGTTVKVAVAARVLLGFENASPSQPVATLWEASGLVELVFGAVANDSVAMAAKVQAALTALKTAISDAVVVPGDGGASLKTDIMASLASWPGSLGSVTVKLKD